MTDRIIAITREIAGLAFIVGASALLWIAAGCPDLPGVR
jgi:hypothetical protein